MVHLNSTKPIVSKNSFFRPKYLGKVKRFKRTTEPTFSMFPLVIGSNQMGMKLDQYTDKMKKMSVKTAWKALESACSNIDGIDSLNISRKYQEITTPLLFGLAFPVKKEFGSNKRSSSYIDRRIKALVRFIYFF